MQTGESNCRERRGEVKVLVTMILTITTIISALGWFNYWIGSAALAKYILDKGYTPPSDEEMKACCTYVLKKLFHIC